MTAYEVAVEFILLGDIMRAFQRAGIPPSTAMQQELAIYRGLLDSELGARQVWTDEQWDAMVRERLTTQNV